jgi:outer membrane protein OmpA-like peptidoglycan-associated protein
MTTSSKRTIATTTVAAFVTLTLAACAATQPRNDMLEHARAAVYSAQGNPQVSGEAEVDLTKAQQALSSGDAMLKAGRPVEEVNHEAYIAERFALAAQKGADLLTSEKAIADANSRRNAVLLAAREQETTHANDLAQRANDLAQTRSAEADAARGDARHSDDLAQTRSAEADTARGDARHSDDLAQRANDLAQTKSAEADTARGDARYSDDLAQTRSAEADAARSDARHSNDLAQTSSAEADAARSDARHSNDLAQTRSAEADAARSDARHSGELAVLSAQQNDAAQLRAQRLESTLADLQAKKTDRGLVITLGDVLFATGQADLRPGARHSLDKLSNFMRQYPQRTVQIEGFTDNVGSDDYNQRLSEHRAEAVRDALTDAGVASDRIRTRGLGKSSPVADNVSATGRQQNRRVEVVISEGDDRTATRLQ